MHRDANGAQGGRQERAPNQALSSPGCLSSSHTFSAGAGCPTIFPGEIATRLTGNRRKAVVLSGKKTADLRNQENRNRNVDARRGTCPARRRPPPSSAPPRPQVAPTFARLRLHLRRDLMRQRHLFSAQSPSHHDIALRAFCRVVVRALPRRASTPGVKPGQQTVAPAGSIRGGSRGND